MNVRRLLVGTAISAGAVFAPHAASAQTTDPYEKPTTEVKGVEFETRPTEVKGIVESQTLPVTGGDIAGLTILGLALVGTGVVLVRRTRLQPATAQA